MSAPRIEERHECPQCGRVQIVYVRGAQVAHRCPKVTAPRLLTPFTPRGSAR